MKNLKDYFSSPRTPEDGTLTTSPVLENAVGEDNNNPKKSKKKRKKDSSTVISVNEGVEEEYPLPRKKKVSKRKALVDEFESSVEKKQKTNSKERSAKLSRDRSVSKKACKNPDSPQNTEVGLPNELSNSKDHANDSSISGRGKHKNREYSETTASDISKDIDALLGKRKSRKSTEPTSGKTSKDVGTSLGEKKSRESIERTEHISSKDANTSLGEKKSRKSTIENACQITKDVSICENKSIESTETTTPDISKDVAASLSEKKSKKSSKLTSRKSSKDGDTLLGGKQRSESCEPIQRSSKEVDTCDSEKEKKKCQESNEASPSEGKKSLLNFFKKVDKTFPVKEDIKQVTVECLVHTPPKEKEAKRLSRLSSAESSPIGDSIRNSINNKWRQRINLSGSVSPVADSSVSLSDDDIVVLDEDNKPKKKGSKKSTKFNQSPGPVNLQGKNNLTKEKSSAIDSGPIHIEDSGSSNQSTKSDTEVQSDVIRVDDDSCTSVEDVRNLRPRLKSGVIRVDDDSCTSTEDDRILRPRLKSDVVMIDDDSCTATEDVRNVRPKLKSGNLAAYFGLKGPDNGKKAVKLTPEQSLARSQFLQSPAPDSIRKLMIKSSVESTGVEAPFPKQNHTRQVDKFNIIWSLDKLPVQLEKLKKPSVIKEITIPKWSSLSSQPPPLLDHPPPPKLSHEDDLPLNAWKNGLKSLKKSNKHAILWTDRYCPSTCSEVALNGKVVDKLSTWLAAASNKDAGIDSDSSSEEFEDGKDSGAKRAGNTALLIGPSGCGKTAAVYAAAKYNQYQVLELNASCNRNGKKIVAEFSEATQSHKVETKSLLKVKKSRSKKKSVESNLNKNLILIEDADIVLDGVDEGYANGLASLQAGSKRPLVLVVNSYQSAKHIHKLPVSVTFTMEQLKPSYLGKYLMSMASVEKMKVDENAIGAIIDATKCDLRKSILALQLGCSPALDENIVRIRMSALSKDEEMNKSNALTIIKTSHALSVLDTITASCQQWTSDYCSIDGQDNRLCSYEDKDSLLGEISSVLLALCSKNSSLTSLEEDNSSVRIWRTKYENHIGEGTASVQCVSRRAISSDYLASVREIARAESIKMETLSRRSARLLSHLSYANLPTDGEDISKLVSSLAPPQITQKEITDKT